MSDGGRVRVWLGVKMWKSSQKWSAQRSAVRSIVWLGLLGGLVKAFLLYLKKLLCVEQRNDFAIAPDPHTISALVGDQLPTSTGR